MSSAIILILLLSVDMFKYSSNDEDLRKSNNSILLDIFGNLFIHCLDLFLFFIKSMIVLYDCVAMFYQFNVKKSTNVENFIFSEHKNDANASLHIINHFLSFVTYCFFGRTVEISLFIKRRMCLSTREKMHECDEKYFLIFCEQ